MPRGDRTGPMGMGPMTGRGAGYCAGYDAPGNMNPVAGRAFGRGWGGGRGWRWRNRYYATGLPGWGAPPTKAQTSQALKQQAEWLKEQLDDINQRLQELE